MGLYGAATNKWWACSEAPACLIRLFPLKSHSSVGAPSPRSPWCPPTPPPFRDISVKAESEGTFDGFWETLAFIINAAVFAYAGAASLNFFIRWGGGEEMIGVEQSRGIMHCGLAITPGRLGPARHVRRPCSPPHPTLQFRHPAVRQREPRRAAAHAVDAAHHVPHPHGQAPRAHGRLQAALPRYQGRPGERPQALWPKQRQRFALAALASSLT